MTAGQKGGINISALDKNNTTYSVCLQHNTNWKYRVLITMTTRCKMVRVDKQIIGQSHVQSKLFEAFNLHISLFPGFVVLLQGFKN